MYLKRKKQINNMICLQYLVILLGIANAQAPKEEVARSGLISKPSGSILSLLTESKKKDKKNDKAEPKLTEKSAAMSKFSEDSSMDEKKESSKNKKSSKLSAAKEDDKQKKKSEDKKSSKLSAKENKTKNDGSKDSKTNSKLVAEKEELKDDKEVAAKKESGKSKLADSKKGKDGKTDAKKETETSKLDEAKDGKKSSDSKSKKTPELINVSNELVPSAHISRLDENPKVKSGLASKDSADPAPTLSSLSKLAANTIGNLNSERNSDLHEHGV